MFSQLFLEFLRENGLLTEKQVKDVSERKKTAKAHIGTLALNSGLMTSKQVDSVVRLQATMDMRFGEIAVMKGYVTQEQFSEILLQQPKEHIYLSQVLTDWGILDFDTIIEQTLNLQNAYGLDDGQMEKLIDNDVTEYIGAIARVGTSHSLFIELAVLFIKLVIRLIERDVLILKAYETQFLAYEYLAYQRCFGSGLELTVCFMPKAEGICTFAERYAKEAVTTVDDLARDAIKEFLNTAIGMFITKMSERNIAELEIDTPVFKERGAIESENPFCVLPFRLPFGEFAILTASGSTSF